MKGILTAVLAFVLAAAVPFTVLGESKDRGTRGTEHMWRFEANGHFHDHWLGGEPRQFCAGRSGADNPPPVVPPVAPPPPTSGSGNGLTGSTGSTGGTVTSSGPGTL